MSRPAGQPTNDGPINIGRRADESYYFQGKIADVRVWNTARTEEQVRTNKDRVLQGNEAGLVGYWRLNEGAGTTAIDSTASVNNGTYVGGVTRTSEPVASDSGRLVGLNTEP